MVLSVSKMIERAAQPRLTGTRSSIESGSANASCIPSQWNPFPLLTDARPPDRGSSICVSGKMKNPAMTTVRVDAFGVTHVPTAADTS